LSRRFYQNILIKKVYEKKLCKKGLVLAFF